MPAATMSQRWKSSIRIALGAILLALLLTMVDLGQLWSSIRGASPVYLIASFLLFALQGVPESIRLKTVYANWGVNFFSGVRLFVVGMFFSNFMPGMIGADVYQIQQLHTIKPGLVQPISLSLLLRISGLLVNLTLALLVIAVGMGTAVEVLDIAKYSSHIPKGFFLYLVLISGMLILVATSPWGRSRLARLDQRISGIRADVFAAIQSLSIGSVIKVLIQGVIIVLLRAASLYVLLLACGAQAGAADVVLAVTVTVLALVVPISFAGIGVREISLSAILVASGVEPHIAVAVSLLGRFFIWLLSLAGGLWFVRHKANP